MFSISRPTLAGRRWRERWPSEIGSNWSKHCCCCWYGQKWSSNRIKNDNRRFKLPKDCITSNSERGFVKEKFVCTFCSTLLSHLSKRKIESHIAKRYRVGRCRHKFFNKFVTGDETWCFPYDPETKRQISEWFGETSPRPKKPKFQRSRIKTMLIFFFYFQCLVYKEFIPEGKQ